MGLEAYLFRLCFDENVDFFRLNNFLLDYGFKVVKKESISEYRSICYELASEKGITEAHILLSPKQKEVDVMHVRFSVISPHNVTDQTFTFFKILNETYGFKLCDTEVSNHIFLATRKPADRKWSGVTWAQEVEEEALIPIDVEEFKKNKMGIRKRRLVLADDKRKKPIRCDETLDHMEKEMTMFLMYLD